MRYRRSAYRSWAVLISSGVLVLVTLLGLLVGHWLSNQPRRLLPGRSATTATPNTIISAADISAAERSSLIGITSPVASHIRQAQPLLVVTVPAMNIGGEQTATPAAMNYAVATALPVTIYASVAPTAAATTTPQEERQPATPTIAAEKAPAAPAVIHGATMADAALLPLVRSICPKPMACRASAPTVALSLPRPAACCFWHPTARYGAWLTVLPL
jgi:hypothetical protein